MFGKFLLVKRYYLIYYLIFKELTLAYPWESKKNLWFSIILCERVVYEVYKLVVVGITKLFSRSRFKLNILWVVMGIKHNFCVHFDENLISVLCIYVCIVIRYV